MDDRDRRRARNETRFRQVNEEIAEIGSARESRRLQIVCECGALACAVPITVSRGEYEEARADPRTFIVHSGHSDPRIERVVSRRADHELVQKIGEAAETAAAADPR
jgi:hypothetical protein